MRCSINSACSLSILFSQLYHGAKAADLMWLKNTDIGRFCDVIKHQMPEYTRYFNLVFHNKTFRVYKVL